MEVTPLARQLFVASCTLLAAFSVGGAATYPLVLLHQLKANDSTIQLDFETSTWVGSIHGLAALPSIFLPALMQWRGRKFAFIAACLILTTGWIIAYTARSTAGLLISESFHGFGSNSLLAVCFCSISEMLAPKHREWVNHSYAVLQALAMALTTILTQFLHWKTISIIMGIPVLTSLLMAIAWPESPYWLAHKGKFEKCEREFFRLRGKEQSKELTTLLNVQKEIRTKEALQKKTIKTFWKQIRNRDFYVPALLMITLQYTMYGSGQIILLIYSIELLEKATQNSSTSTFGGVIMNSLLCIGITISLVVNRYINKKTVLLSSLIVIFIALSSATVLSYMQTVEYIPKDSISCLYCMMVDMLAAGIGVFPTVIAISTELMPVKHRGVGGGLLIMNTCLMHSFTLKCAPYLFFYIDLWGTFLIFTVTTICCGVIIWKFVPRTSGKTLQEIESYYKSERFEESNEHRLSLMGDRY